MSNTPKKDLLVLVADRNMEAAVAGVLSRYRSLGVRAVEADIQRHPEKDSGCRVAGVEYLSAFINQYEHGLLMFDHEGCGQETLSAKDLEVEIGSALAHAGWGDKAAAIVLEPELESWVWSDSPHVAEELGWAGRQPSLRSWLSQQGFWPQDAIKPHRPKEALEAALRQVRKPRSSAIYQGLAEKVSLKRCTDRGFLRLKRVLSEWFAR